MFTPPASVEEARQAIAVLGTQLARAEVSLELHNALIEDMKVYISSVAVDKLGVGQKFDIVDDNTDLQLACSERRRFDD